MSGVFARNRKETKLQFYIIAQNLQVALTNFVMREKNLPKKWRYMIGQSLIAKVDELMDNIVYANSIFPTKDMPELLVERKHYQQCAIICCYQLQNKLLRMIECVQSVKIENLATEIDLLNQEVILLRAWKKSNKLY